MNEYTRLTDQQMDEMTEQSVQTIRQWRLEVTEGRLAETALYRLAAIVEHSSDAIIGKNLDSIITDWNKGAEKIFGYTAEEMVGTSIMRLIPEDRQHEEALIIGKVSQGETLEHFETVRRKKGGSPIHISVTVSPIKNASGEIVGVSKVARDITEQKKAQEIEKRLGLVTASNQKLEEEILRRQAVEKDLLESEKHLKKLQLRARQLAHRILHTQEEERLRVSRELHDQVVQNLIGINVRLISLSKQAKNLSPEFQEQLVLTQELLGNSVETVHQVARELRPTVLSDLGLIPTLNGFFKTFTQQSGVHVDLAFFSEVEKVNGVILTALYRVAVEALQNVARHAKARRVEVNIQRLGQQVCMTLRDDGRGFNTDPLQKARKEKRLGLIGMQERLEMVGGTFDIQSASGRGTTVTAVVPFSSTL